MSAVDASGDFRVAKGNSWNLFTVISFGIESKKCRYTRVRLIRSLGDLLIQCRNVFLRRKRLLMREEIVVIMSIVLVVVRAVIMTEKCTFLVGLRWLLLQLKDNHAAG